MTRLALQIKMMVVCFLKRLPHEDTRKLTVDVAIKVVYAINISSTTIK